MEAALFLLRAISAVVHEAALFSAIWFMIGGLDDLAIDVAYVARRMRDWLGALGGASPRLRLTDQGNAPARSHAVFVPAWDEARVIGPMLASLLERLDHPDFTVFVGTYPNDPATGTEAARIAAGDARLHCVTLARSGPTTKADCLNHLWAAMLAHEAACDRTFDAIVVHDAEDFVHARELRVFDRLLASHDAVQLPVLPLISPQSRLIGGHYADEFAESHAKTLWVRELFGRGLPLAGTGCAVRRDMLARIAGRRGGTPFDPESLTEDYELGLAIGALGGRATISRQRDAAGSLIAVRAYFPETLGASVRQKARWMIGIALAGWDRTGWAPARHLGDHWMRMRDRRATLAAPVLAIAYLALVGWGLSLLLGVAIDQPLPSLPPGLGWLLAANAALLGWRAAVRAWFVGRIYGPVEAMWSLPRMLVGNIIALMAARRAVIGYLAMLAGARPRWDKTEHRFPEALALQR